MKFLKGFSINLLVGLNVFILFYLFFENKVLVPAPLRVIGRMHPLVLHFPIALLILTVLLAFFKQHLPIERTAKELLMTLLLFACSVCSALTVVFGLLLSSEDGYSGDILLWHKWLGISMSFLITFTLFGYHRRFNSKIVNTLLTVSTLLMLVGGHFGATLTHGEEFLTEPLSQGKAAITDLNDAKVYSDLVEPILREKCYNCHNPDKAKGQLIMTDLVSLKKGGKSGALFKTGTSGQSLLMERLTLAIDHKHRMPPKGKPQLTENEIELVREWVVTGASFTARLGEIPKSNKIHPVAATIYSSDEKPDYDFEPADETVVQALNTNYRLVAPLSYASPGLSVSFFSRNMFDAKMLEDLRKIENQVVYLNLSGMKVTDQDMKIVAHFPNLRRLNLNNTEITDKGLADFNSLKHLESLMITGTGVTATGIRSLMDLPKLSHVYAWNTSINSAQVTDLLKKNPRIQIATGFNGGENNILNLSAPQIFPASAFFRKPFMLDFRHPINGAEIIYTLDNTEPDSIHPNRFSKPIKIAGNTVVKAKALKTGWGSSKVIERNFQISSKKPDKYSLLTLPDPNHKGKGIETLFDLTEGSTDILYASDGKWLGYRNQDFVAEIEFLQPQFIREIVFSTLTNVGSESFPPAEVQVWILDKNNEARLAVKVVPEQAVKDMPAQHHLIQCKIDHKTPISRMKLVVKPLGKLPEWHPKKGMAAWFFLDEILIN